MLASTHGLPFPEPTSEPMLPGKRETHRFGETDAYRDVPFAVAFVVQLVAVCVIALANGMSVFCFVLCRVGGSGRACIRVVRILE